MDERLRTQRATVAQVVEQVGQCSEGCHLCHGSCVLGQDTSPTLPRVNVSDCCIFVVVVRGAVGAEWCAFRQTCQSTLGVLKSAIQIQSIIIVIKAD